METNTKRGFRCGGTAPFGYNNVKVLDAATGQTRTKLEINEAEAVGVRIVFESYAKGLGLGKIIQKLDKAGIRPRRAKEWQKSGIHNMLRWEVYRGVLIWRKKNSKNPEEWVRYEGGCPAIVSEDAWSRVQAIHKRNKEDGSGHRSQTAHHPLAGLIWCGVCGSRYTARLVGKSGTYYACTKRKGKSCSNRINVKEEILVENLKIALAEQILTPQNVRKSLEALASTAQIRAKEEEKSLRMIEKRLEQISVQQGVSV